LDAEPLGLPGEAPHGFALGGGAHGFLAEAAAVIHSSVPEPRPAVVASAQPAPVSASPGPAASEVRRATEVLFTPPQFRARAEPIYPERARRAGVEGRVTVRLRLSATGSVLTAEIADSSGSDSLDAAALRAAQASGFSPARLGDRFVPAEATATYRFELK